MFTDELLHDEWITEKMRWNKELLTQQEFPLKTCGVGSRCGKFYTVKLGALRPALQYQFIFLSYARKHD